jgi:hypothetical protein
MHTPVAVTVSLAALVTSSVVLAQSQVVPPSAAWNDANAASPAPFSYEGGSRTQHLIEGVALSARIVRQFAYRRDAGTGTFAAKQMANFKVTIGYSGLTAATMSTTFASNRSGNQTVVFQGTYSRPAQPPAPVVGPWNVVFKLATPFVYVPAQGNLLLELEEAGSAASEIHYDLDAVKADATTGWTARFGSNGAFKSQETYAVACPTPASLRPGGAATVTASGLSQDYPAAVAYGFSATQYGPLGLPFDLTAVGAPGNTLYVSLDLIVPIILSGGRGSTSLPIPNSAGLAGVSLFGQGLFLSAASNSLGIVWSAGVSMMLSGDQPMQVLSSASSLTATGGFLFGPKILGGMVVEIR